MPTEIAGETYWTLLELVALFPRASRPSLETIRRSIRKGKLKATKLGRAVLVSSNALRALLDGSPKPVQTPKITPGNSRETPTPPARTRLSFREALKLDHKLSDELAKRTAKRERALRMKHNRLSRQVVVVVSRARARAPLRHSQLR